jgi:hypothetical protein
MSAVFVVPSAAWATMVIAPVPTLPAVLPATGAAYPPVVAVLVLAVLRVNVTGDFVVDRRNNP